MCLGIGRIIILISKFASGYYLEDGRAKLHVGGKIVNYNVPHDKKHAKSHH